MTDSLEDLKKKLRLLHLVSTSSYFQPQWVLKIKIKCLHIVDLPTVLPWKEH